jgi:hypothetical protein
VGGREAGGKSIPTERRLARIEKHDIVRHQAEQADKIACVDGIDPDRVRLADHSFIRPHLQPPPSNRNSTNTFDQFDNVDRNSHGDRRARPIPLQALFSGIH